MTSEVVRSPGTYDPRLLLSRAGAPATALVGFVPVVSLAGAQGGYFPTARGWATIPLLWAVGITLVVRDRIRLSKPERLFLGTLVALVGWLALSTTWSLSPDRSALEAERALVYLSAVAAALLISRSRHVAHFIAGVLAAVGVIATFGLTSRLAPDRVGIFDSAATYRLSHPIGYWNGLALFAGMGALMALVFVARARSLAARSASAGLLVLLLPTLYFTFGRAAWIALVAGGLAAVAVDPRRLQLLSTLLVVGLAPAAAVWLGSRERGLTHADATFERAVHDGHRFAVVLLALAAVNVAAALGLARLEQRLEAGLFVRRAFAGALLALVVGGLSATFLHYGGPVTLVEKGYEAFKAPPPHVSGDLNRRLLSFSGNGRADLWRLAWNLSTEHPALGAGAGTYERYFLANQPTGIGRVRDAHGLYIEILAELGPAGLILLLAFLSVPIVTIRAARWHPLVPGAVGAYVAYLVHAGVDWDWELPGVTLVGLLCGSAILIAGRRSYRSTPLIPLARGVGVAAVITVAAFAAIGLVGNSALSRSERAREDQDWSKAAEEARKAQSWMPWSARPWSALGRAELSAGRVEDARASFRKAVSIDRGDWQLWYYLASAETGRARQYALGRADRLIPRANLLGGSERAVEAGS